MNDRELLELAAKANGSNLVWCDLWKGMARFIDEKIGFDFDSYWNPLADKGQALDLAASLHINIRYSWDGCDDQYDEVWAEKGRVSCCEQIGMLPNGYEFDSSVATCCAIVRTAAEIGKVMK